MGRHRLEYMIPGRVERPRVPNVAASVAIHTGLLLILTIATVGLCMILYAVLRESGDNKPWMVIFILVGAIVACAWGGIAGALVVHRQLTNSRGRTDTGGTN